MTAHATTHQPALPQNLVDRNRRAGRLQDPAPTPALRRKKELAGMHLLPDELQHARELAEADERPLTVFLRRVYLRGLQAYLQERGAEH